MKSLLNSITLNFIFFILFTFCSNSSSPSNPEGNTTEYVLGNLSNDPITVPAGEAITIDGNIDEAAWESAIVFPLATNKEVKLMYADGYLYIGLITGATPVSNIFLYRENHVSMLHSSAAVGTAEYKYNGSEWLQIKEFSWYCRDGSMSESAQNAREQFLQSEGWIANIGYMGEATEVEFKIAMPEESLIISVASLGSPNYNQLSYWPGNINDSCTNPIYLQGPIPETAFFTPEQWIKVIKPD